jgi:thiosulfate dehydrogenase [quinone] large subunit
VPDDPDDGPPLRQRLASATVPAAALLPLRFFFGATFLYAGLDKLLDPAFFDPSSPASIQSLLVDFGRVSPIGGLVRLAEPLAVPMGLGIAIAEIAIGLGALSGLAFRVAAAGGAVLAFLFWLTASWATRPYYYGPDLPYAVGWLVLALAGTGGLLVPRRLRSRPAIAVRRDRSRRQASEGPGIERRVVLQTGLLAVAAVTVASLAVPLRILGLELTGRPAASSSPTPTGSPVAEATPTGSPVTEATPSPVGSAPPGIPVAKLADVEQQGTASFTIPFDAPAPLPAGDPGIIVQLADGSFVAFDALCTHEGCTVEWDAPDGVIFCPCHGAAFDPAHDAAVLAGPTNRPLASLPLVIDRATGQILLQT